ncbi:hypothetical protein VTJ04DRAFT_255 [Mycothermus thermophilus]|uniref:uncharacterized protein n=1 Tax=Humicola insolens TaxID=85995 RepID=UPI003743E8D4
MNSQDGEGYIRSLATFVRAHEKALANALQRRRQSVSRHGPSNSISSIPAGHIPPSPTVPERPSTSASASNAFAAAFSLGSLSWMSSSPKSTRLTLTPHHLFYLLSRFEEMGISVGPMKIRLENLHDPMASANYVSFLSQTHRSKTRGSDVGSIHSVSSIRSVMSSISSLWASFGFGSSISAARTERQKAALQADLKYLYSAFTKIPCLKLSPDWRLPLIKGYEEFPFDSAVPLYAFKNLQELEVCDVDFRQFFGWDRLADQLRQLVLRRASIEDPADVLFDIVLDDMDKRRRRTSKTHNSSPTPPLPKAASPRKSSPAIPNIDFSKSAPLPGVPGPRKSTLDLQIGQLGEVAADQDIPQGPDSRRPSIVRIDAGEPDSPSKNDTRNRSYSPKRPGTSRTQASCVRSSHKIRRSGSGSSNSSLSDSWHGSRSSSTLLATGNILPSSKWRFLKHLGLPDNALTAIPATSLAPLANTLLSLDLSSNLFTQIPDSLAVLTALRALNLAHCMIDSLHSLTRNPLPAITALNLRANRLQSLAGIEKLLPLERLDLRENKLTDPMELARLTGLPEIREVYVEGNPFTRTHRDYRIIIFNLFRRTPGYTEDILVDGTGPTYSEKRYLVERAEVPPPVPVVKPEPTDMPPVVDVSKPAITYDAPIKEHAVLRKDKPLPKTATTEVNTSSGRRRRAPKRRIVDLATNDTPVPYARPVERPSQPAPVAAVADDRRDDAPDVNVNYRTSNPPETQDLLPGSSQQTTSQPIAQSLAEAAPRDILRINTTTDSTAVPKLSSPGSDFGSSPRSVDWDAEGELYRQRIEDIRSKVGAGYLSVLGEEGGLHQRHDHLHDSSPPDISGLSIHSDPMVPRSSQGMVVPQVVSVSVPSTGGSATAAAAAAAAATVA